MTKKKFALIALMIVTGAALIGCGPKEVTLDVYAGDALRIPLKEIKATYEEQNPHVTIYYNIAASDAVAETVRTLEQGDVTIIGARVTNDLEKDGLLVTSYLVATQVLVIAVREGSAAVTSWDDLVNEGVRIAYLNPKMGPIGELAKKTIANSSAAEDIQANVTALASDVSDALQLVNDGKVDAAIVTPSLALQTDGIAIIAIPEDVVKKVPLAVSVLVYTTAEEEARAFMEFVASEEGKQVFLNSGFIAIEK